MPLSARSSNGPVSLFGMDQLTLDNLKIRNRKEKIFTAKCCGAPVQIRTPAGKIAHFYHLSTMPGCQGGRGETQEHLALKSRIAAAVIRAGWEAEVEAEERGLDGKLVWKADVLARKGKVKVAFEVELSNPDWESMTHRQARYKRSGVRGLWFVKTKKPFPVQQSLPIFNLTRREDDVWLVSLRHPANWEDDWSLTWGLCNLTQFVTRSLAGGLKWAPYRTQREMRCDVSANIHPMGTCLNCHRNIGYVYYILVGLTDQPSFPVFHWHQGMTNRRTHWVDPVLAQLSNQFEENTQVGLIAPKTDRCSGCGASANQLGRAGSVRTLTLEIRLMDLPQARYGTIEWDWFNRWVLLRD